MPSSNCIFAYDLIHVTLRRHSYHTHVMVWQGHVSFTGHIPGLGVQYLDTGITTGEPDHCFTPTPPSYHLPHYTILSPSTRPLIQTAAAAESTSVSRANKYSHILEGRICAVFCIPQNQARWSTVSFFAQNMQFLPCYGREPLSCVVHPQIWSVLCVTCPHQQKCLCTSRRYAAR